MKTFWRTEGLAGPLILVTYLCLTASCGSLAGGTGPRDRDPSAGLAQVVTKYLAVEAATVNLETRSKRTNEGGALAWGTSYLMESYIDMYEATHSQVFLKKFISLSSGLAERTDAALGIPDYAGRRRVGWGSTRYSWDGKRMNWLVHTGMITFPLARFALTVQATADTPGLRDGAVQMQRLAEMALKEFDADWRYDRARGEGFYVYAADAPLRVTAGYDTPLSFNEQLAGGRTYIVLLKLTGDPAYRERAEGLARHFKRRLRQDAVGGYEWDYWYGKGLSRYSAREDISHGAIDVDFAVIAARESLVFGSEDLERFVAAFLRETDAATGVMKKPDDAVGRWLGLSEVDCRVYSAVRPYFMAKTGVQHPQVLLGLAKLARYADRCTGN